MARETIVLGLCISPRFSTAMEAGEEPFPYVNHDSVDWRILLSSLKLAFDYALQHVNLRIADDTVDLTVVKLREDKRIPGPLDCKDFGHVLQQRAKETRKTIIPIRRDWQELQFIQNRTESPPPVLIPLVLTGSGTELGICFHTMQQLMGVRAALDFSTTCDPEFEPPEDYHQGRLPKEILEMLQEQFGIAYEEVCTLIPIVHIDPLALMKS
jgi:hypothetical protein